MLAGCGGRLAGLAAAMVEGGWTAVDMSVSCQGMPPPASADPQAAAARPQVGHASPSCAVCSLRGIKGDR